MQSTRPYASDEADGVRGQLQRGRDEAREIGAEVAQIVAEIGELASREVQLAAAELSDQASLAGRTAAALAAGGILALVALGCLAATAILALANLVDEGLAGVIVTLVFAALAGAGVMTGLGTLREIKPGPQQALKSLKEDVRWARELMRRNAA
jgi:hypothetical protein